MRYLIKLLLVIIFVISCVFNIASQEKVQYKSIIKGKVLNNFGQPVENAIVVFDVAENFYKNICWVKNNTVFSDKEGNFVHEEYCSLKNRKVSLFIVPKVGLSNSDAPLYPPFWSTLRRNNPKFAGLSVNIEGNQEIDLGNVPIQVWYNKFELFVLNKNSKPYYKNNDDWGNFHLIVRDELGDDVGSSALSIRDIENKVNIEKGLVKIALPEGSWVLELLADENDYDNTTGKTRRFLAKTTVKITKNEAILPVRLIIKQNK